MLLDVEEITHKAGNFKKFSVFTKMLSAAFTEEKDSVLYVDLLTYSDLELLKARKNGGVNNLSNNTQAVQSNKRYVILTYSGKLSFDMHQSIMMDFIFIFFDVTALAFFICFYDLSLTGYLFLFFTHSLSLYLSFPFSFFISLSLQLSPTIYLSFTCTLTHSLLLPLFLPLPLPPIFLPHPSPPSLPSIPLSHSLTHNPSL